MCRPRSSPMAPIIVAEFAATARPSIGTFQTLSAGKIGQAGAPGTVGRAAGVAGRRRRRWAAAGASPAGWLEALRGSVPALYSAPSVQPSWSVSATRGFVPSVCSVRVREAVAVGVLATVPQAVAVGVGAARRRAGQEFEGGPQPVAVGVLAAVADAVAVRVGPARVHAARRIPAGWSGRRGRDPRAPSGRPSRSVSARDGLVSEYGPLPGVRAGRRGRCRSRRPRRPAVSRPGDEQDGRQREPRATMPRAIHARDRAAAARPDGNASVVPAAGPRGPVPAGNAPRR